MKSLKRSLIATRPPPPVSRPSSQVDEVAIQIQQLRGRIRRRLCWRILTCSGTPQALFKTLNAYVAPATKLVVGLIWWPQVESWFSGTTSSLFLLPFWYAVAATVTLTAIGWAYYEIPRWLLWCEDWRKRNASAIFEKLALLNVVDPAPRTHVWHYVWPLDPYFSAAVLRAEDDLPESHTTGFTFRRWFLDNLPLRTTIEATRDRVPETRLSKDETLNRYLRAFYAHMPPDKHLSPEEDLLPHDRAS